MTGVVQDEKRVITLAIVGAEGINERTEGKLNDVLYKRGIEQVQHVLEHTWSVSPSTVRLVSGGSPWFQHVAVAMYLDQLHEHADDPDIPEFLGLELIFPCEFNRETYEFDTKSEIGQALNEQHRVFSAKLGRNSLEDIVCAMSLGATVKVPDKTEDRACSRYAQHIRIVDAATHIITFTWDGLDVPADAKPLSLASFSWWRSMDKIRIQSPLQLLATPNYLGAIVRPFSNHKQNLGGSKPPTFAAPFDKKLKKRKGSATSSTPIVSGTNKRKIVQSLLTFGTCPVEK